MVINFMYDDDFDHRKELESIIKSQIERHFNPEDYFDYQNNYASYWGGSVHINLSNLAFFEDIEKAKEKMAEMSDKYMTDFISEVQENLSFIPKIIVE